MPNTTKVYKNAIITQQIAGKLLAQANKEDNIAIKAQIRQLAGKKLSEANKIIREEKEKVLIKKQIKVVKQ